MAAPVLAARRAQGGRRAGAWGTARCLHRQGERAGNPQQRLDQGLQPLRGHSRADPQGIYPRHPSGRVSGQLFRSSSTGTSPRWRSGRRAAPEPGRTAARAKGWTPASRSAPGTATAAYNYALVNTSLAAGSTPDDHVRACMKAFSAKGTRIPAYIPVLPGQKLPRGKVMYGMARATTCAIPRGAPARRGASRRARCRWCPPAATSPARPWCLRLEPGSSARPRPDEQGHRNQVPAQSPPPHRRPHPARQRGREGNEDGAQNGRGPGRRAEGRPRRPLPHP